jgi:gluconokinase
MLDKIRLHAAGQLPKEYVENLGEPHPFTLDGRCCRFLGVSYAEIRRHALAGETDDAVLVLAHANGIHERTRNAMSGTVSLPS